MILKANSNRVLLKFAGDMKMGGIISMAEDEDIRQKKQLSQRSRQCDKLQRNGEQDHLDSCLEFALKTGNLSAGNGNG